jgi:hypothetical protein
MKGIFDHDGQLDWFADLTGKLMHVAKLDLS